MKNGKRILTGLTETLLFVFCILFFTSCCRSDGSPGILTSLLVISLFGQDAPDPGSVYIMYHHTGDSQAVRTLDPGILATNTISEEEYGHTRRLLAHSDLPYCVDSLTVYKEGYHSMWYYERYCRAAEDTLRFEMKPYQIMEVRLQSSRPLSGIELVTQLEPATRSPGVHRNTRLDRTMIVPGAGTLTDTTLYMRIVAQEPVTLLVQYTDAGDPALQYRSIPVGISDVDRPLFEHISL